MTKLTTRPNSKINLGLRVVSRRPDGYHNLETVFYPISLCDELTLETADKDEFFLEGIPVDGNPMNNLVMRVLQLLREEGRVIPPLRVTLKKNIPSGAGLGGGSSDAAFMLKMLNEMFSLGLTVKEMEQWISRLGADCAVFIQNKPVFAEGIGNLFTPIDLSLSGWHFVLIKPDDFVSTKEAYSLIKPKRPNTSLIQLVNEDVNMWREKILNDFETSVFPRHPRVKDIRDELYEMGATYAAMSGSGSSVFGLFAHPVELGDLFQQYFRFQCQL
jgi:4-diphosphocytidyl-2-C-methyl-D-erythritol kinase